jgi:phospholipid transport system substrate-binding protein
LPWPSVCLIIALINCYLKEEVRIKMKRLTKWVAGYLSVFLLATGVASAAPAVGSDVQFIEGLGQKALSILADKSIPREQALQEFKTMLNTNFDVPAIGRFVIGRHWNAATPEQQSEYQQLFVKIVEKIYTDRFSLYSGEKFAVGTSRADTGDDSIVSSQVVRPQGPPVNVEWRVRKYADGSLKILDVIVEGVSMSVTQRAEFASVITRGGGNVEALLVEMRKRAQPGVPAEVAAPAIVK